jgi:hypothetical protein
MTDLTAGVDERVRVAIYDIWRNLFELSPETFDPQRGFIESGGYSLLALKLLDAVERALSVRVELAEVLADLSASSLVERVVELTRLKLAVGSPSEGSDGEWEEGII